MKPIELDTFFHNEDTSKLEEMGMDYDVDDCDIRKMTFYDIKTIAPYFGNNDDKNYCTVGANGSPFICKITYSQLKALLNG